METQLFITAILVATVAMALALYVLCSTITSIIMDILIQRQNRVYISSRPLQFKSALYTKIEGKYHYLF